MMELSNLLQQAIDHHQQGHLEEAERLYRAILQVAPRHHYAHHLLGQLARQRGQPRSALSHLMTAVSANPTVGQYWLALVEALLECGEYGEAERVLAEACAHGLEGPAVVELTARLAAATLKGEAPSPDPLPATQPPTEEEASELQEAAAACNSGNLALALEKAQRLLAKNSGLALAWAIIAQVRWKQGEAVAAEEAARRALAIEPNQREALLALALSLHAQERYEESEALFRQALLAYPKDAEIYSYFSALLQKIGKWPEAQAVALRAIELNPTYADAWVNYGSALLESGERERAASAYQAALQFNPQRVEALYCLGRLAAVNYDFPKALDYFDKALTLCPHFVESLLAKAEVYEFSDQLQEAESCARLALQKKPHHFDAHLALAFALAAQGKDGEAEEVLQAARQCRPQPSDAAERILATQIAGRLHLPAIPESQAAIAHWRARYREGLNALLDLPGTLTDPTQYFFSGSLSFYLAYHNADDRALMEGLCRLFRAKAPQLNFEAPHVARWQFPTGRRIRVGFCSQLLVNHTIGKLYQGLLGQLDRSRFEVILIYPPQAERDQLRARLEAACDRTVTLSGRLPQWQAQVAALELDALFYPDIGMWLSTYFLAYARLAPVQMVSYGHPDTTGIDTVDYFLGGDAPMEPEGAEAYYSERLVRFTRLPFCYQLFSVPTSIPSRTELGLPEHGRLYGCPQSSFKLHPDFDAVLAAIAEGDPEGHIVMIEDYAKARSEQLRARWAKSAPILNERVCFLPGQPLDRFMALVAHCNVLLDPIHFGSGNNLYESMAYGKPIVTWPGRFARGRFVAAAYEQMGIAEIAPIAPSIEDYAPTALAFARDQERCLAFASKAVAAAKTHLYFDLGAVRQFEAFLLAALEAAAQGEKLPSGFRVPPPKGGS
jgi:protein O-GlcNAc transferase